MNQFQSECPYCNHLLKVLVPRWDSKINCYKCNNLILIDYDMIWMEIEGEEWDLYEFKKLNKDDKFLDLAKIDYE